MLAVGPLLALGRASDGQRLLVAVVIVRVVVSSAYVSIIVKALWLLVPFGSPLDRWSDRRCCMSIYGTDIWSSLWSSLSFEKEPIP